MIRIRPLLSLAVCVAAIAVAAPASGGDSFVPPAVSPPRLIETREPQDCLQKTPATYAVPDAGSDSPLVIDALFLADGIDAAEAQAVADLAATPYEKLGIELRVTVREQAFAADGTRTTTRGSQPTVNADALTAAAKALFPGGHRPLEFDVVYVLTTKDLWLEDLNDRSQRDYGVAGLADCIGGVRYADRAFAVGEVDDGFNLVLQFSPDFTAIVAAHEIGHLMGAHHHYAVCGTTAGQVARLRGDVCTIMFPEASTPSLEFSPQNGLIVYGHTRDYATP